MHLTRPFRVSNNLTNMKTTPSTYVDKTLNLLLSANSSPLLPHTNTIPSFITTMPSFNILIIGGGLGGLATAGNHSLSLSFPLLPFQYHFQTSFIPFSKTLFFLPIRKQVLTPCSLPLQIWTSCHGSRVHIETSNDRRRNNHSIKLYALLGSFRFNEATL